jgi:hypothetical protein
MANEFADNLKLLQHYPIDIEVASIIHLAVALQEEDSDNNACEPQTPSPISTPPHSTAQAPPNRAAQFRMLLEKGSGVLQTWGLSK